jgi:hypothetical protein
LKIPEPGHVALLAVLEEHLLPDADPQERLVPCGFQHRGTQAAGIELAHAVGHGALAGKDDPVGRQHFGRVSRHHHGVGGGHVLDGLGHRTQVAHAVIDDRNLAHRAPLVDGITPAWRGSGVTAMRRARPKALNTVSHW